MKKRGLLEKKRGGERKRKKEVSIEKKLGLHDLGNCEGGHQGSAEH